MLYHQDSHITLHQGDALATLRELPSESVHCCVTSPPYYNLRDYGCDGQIGLENTPDKYINRLVDVFREVRRVLRSDGTLWVVIGDSYAGSGCGSNDYRLNGASLSKHDAKYKGQKPGLSAGLKQKDLIGIPWMLAFALRADGWWIRSDIIWAKNNCMPESVTDRPTKSHEYVFLLTKRADYYFDQEAVREGLQASTIERYQYGWNGVNDDGSNGARTGSSFAKMKNGMTMGEAMGTAGRNIRTVWTVPTQSFSAAHFATFPEALVRRCLAAGTSERGVCVKCGTPWVRLVETNRIPATHPPGRGKGARLEVQTGGVDTSCFVNGLVPVKTTLGWQPSCRCEAPTVPATVLDPFAGSGTVGVVAKKMGCRAVLIELNPEYCAIAVKRIGPQAVLL